MVRQGFSIKEKIDFPLRTRQTPKTCDIPVKLKPPQLMSTLWQPTLM